MNDLTTKKLVGERLRKLIKQEIKNQKYRDQQDFFSKVQKRIDKNNTEKISVNVSNVNTFNKYLTGETNMKIEVLKQICIELNCTSDYLLGLTPHNMNTLDIIRNLIKESGYNLVDLLEDA